ncbi:MAG: two-component sensor histidine kinase [Acidimicrobiaceae bacterium]|nr:two-component sensor histidine kinase [Acidimicrobiaceae bacterium]
MNSSKKTQRLGSIRTRIALLYSVLLFGLAAIILGVIYLSFSESLSDEKISQQYLGVEQVDANKDRSSSFEEIDELILFEENVNRNAVEELRDYIFLALAGLLLISLIVGWYVAGIVLKPIKHISFAAREISATDLSKRIDLRGPSDELRDLADTFDEMLTRLDKAFRNQREFLEEAAHELRNPLAVMRANLEVVSADPDSTIEDFVAASEVAGRASDRMGKLVDDLLLYAHHERPDLQRVNLDLTELVINTVEDFQAEAKSSEVLLGVECDSDLEVVGDPSALRRAFANILSNSIRVSEKGKHIYVKAGNDAEMVWISVSDEGPGLDPEDSEKVFDRFWKGDEVSAREAGRSGLGLAIVKTIVETHGGRSTVRSTKGEGSTFTIWLPRLIKG